MEIRISNLKSEFNNISLIRSKIMNVFECLKNKSDKLKNLYSDFIKHCNTQLFVFGLDSFHFQSKLIDLEYDDMQRIFLFVNNRMYCEYFKLYKLISSYVIEHITDKKILEIIKGNNFPVYKDLEPFKDYKFELIIDVHENILILLNSISSIINNRENELSIHRSKQLTGLNIDNFVNSFNYEITLMREKINLFLSYIEFFHKLHAKYLKRFSNKIQLMANNVNSDIQFDENTENNENNKVNDNDDNDDELVEQHNNKVKLVIDTKTIDFENNNNESGLNTPSNGSYKSYTSFKSTESKNANDKKIKVSKFIKNGFKKVGNIISGCNNSKTIDNGIENTQLVLDKFSLNKINEKLIISLNDFSDNISENIEELVVVVEEPPLVVVEEQPLVVAEEEPVVVVEEQPLVVAEEEPVVVVEEQPVVVVEEELVVEEKPVVVVEEEPHVVVVEEEPVVVVEEEPVVVVEEEPVVVVEEEPPLVVVEEPPLVVAEEEPPVVVVEEEPPVVVVEEEPPLVVAEEQPPVVVVEEHPVLVVEEQPVVVVEEEPVVAEPLVEEVN